MATRKIGKYKVSKKESALSIADGGTIDGKLILSGLSDPDGASLTSNQVYYTSSLALTHSALNVLIKG
tara:strand:+ start:309 stop:512 length:204 start_codon:yes stop_codon:yes gene_type:complete